MGRAERRRMERQNRIEDRKGKLLVTREDISKMKRETVNQTSTDNVEALMTCFALAEHRLYGFGHKRILRSLEMIDELMGPIIDGSVTIEDYKRELEEEAGVAIRCSP